MRAIPTGNHLGSQRDVELEEGQTAARPPSRRTGPVGPSGDETRSELEIDNETWHKANERAVFFLTSCDLSTVRKRIMNSGMKSISG